MTRKTLADLPRRCANCGCGLRQRPHPLGEELIALECGSCGWGQALPAREAPRIRRRYSVSMFGSTAGRDHYLTATEAITHAVGLVVAYQTHNAPDAAHADVFAPNGQRIASTEPVECQHEIDLGVLAAWYAAGDFRPGTDGCRDKARQQACDTLNAAQAEADAADGFPLCERCNCAPFDCLCDKGVGFSDDGGADVRRYAAAADDGCGPEFGNLDTGRGFTMPDGDR